MKLRSSSVWTWVGMLLVPWACAKKSESGEQPSPQSSAASPVQVEQALGLSDAEKKEAERLALGLDAKRGRFAQRDLTNRANARLFTHLAGMHEDPKVVVAALLGMQQGYSAHSKRKEEPDQAFVEVVQKRLDSQDAEVVSAALGAARSAITGQKARTEVIDAILKQAPRYPSGPGRYAILDTLRVLSTRYRDERVVGLFTQSLEAPEPYVVSQALHGLSRVGRALKDKDQVRTSVWQLAKHEDPGVRGRAIELLGSIGKDDDEVRALVTAALADKHPYVRSEAADAMARLRYRDGIHDLMKLIDDKADNSYVIEGWTGIDTRPGQLRHDGSPWSRVYDAAMNAIRNLAAGRLKLERVNPKEREVGLDKNAALTKAWYAQNKGKLAELGTPPRAAEPGAKAPSPSALNPQKPAASTKNSLSAVPARLAPAVPAKPPTAAGPKE